MKTKADHWHTVFATRLNDELFTVLHRLADGPEMVRAEDVSVWITDAAMKAHGAACKATEHTPKVSVRI